MRGGPVRRLTSVALVALAIALAFPATGSAQTLSPGPAEPIRQLPSVVATEARDQAQAIAPAAFALLMAGVMVTLGMSLVRRIV